MRHRITHRITAEIARELESWRTSLPEDVRAKLARACAARRPVDTTLAGADRYECEAAESFRADGTPR